jgi:anti-anti-sigma factor
MNAHDPGELPRCETRDPLPGCRVVHIFGDVDAHSAPALQAKLLADLAAAPLRLVVDLAEVEFLDSAGIRCLVSLCRAAGKLSERVQLVMPRREGVRRALDLVAIEHLLRIAPGVDAALE